MFPFVQSPDSLEQRRQLQRQRLHHRVQLQTRQIERVMDERRLPAQVSGGVIDAHTIQFDLQAQLQGSWEWIRGLTADFRQALGVPQLSVTRENGRLQVSVARPVEAPVRLLDVLAMGVEVGEETAVIGLSYEGEPVLLPLQEHILISGIENAGKTSLIRSIAMSLALSNRQSRLQQVIIAPVIPGNNTISDLKPLTLLPHMSAHIAFRLEEAVQILNWLVEEMENRLQWGERKPVVILMIDQVVELMEAGGQMVEEAVTKLLQRGVEAGIHLILTTARPQSPRLDTHLKANLPVRIIGQTEDSIQADAASGIKNSEAEYLRGHGDFLLIHDGRQLFFQSAYISDYDLHLCLKKLLRKYKISILAQPYL
ncbi:MAG: hypothetical protein IAF02_05645, partial [Anaerolineae bacterium]|nr:hypothetical protein [Anaerolineae bacterium]